MRKHIVRREVDPANIRWPASLHSVVRRVYARRGLRSPKEIEPRFEHLHSFSDLRGIEPAARLLEEALRGQWSILVVADFDADGATSCALAVRALRMMGAEQVQYLVPNRFEYGYGLTPEIVQVAAASRPDLLITVDNGISSLDGVRTARTQGMRVLVTDHHLAGPELPPADVIVNPNLPNDTFPSKHLAGVGVIFYVMLALRARLRARGWFAQPGRPEPNLAQLLDLVTLGTVADVVTLDHNNRILVAQGLARIRKGHCCEGIRALIKVSGRRQDQLVAADLGFALGPRLNAAGRLDDMSLGIACLLSDSPREALELAAHLDALNRERRSIEAQMQAQALAQLEALQLNEEANSLPAGLCLFQPQWHEGIIGLLASRIKDRLNRPVIAFAKALDGKLKGSARTIAGLHIRDVLEAVATHHPGLVQRFGGHAMAAGLTLQEGHLPAFQAAFEQEVSRLLGSEALRGVIYSDGELASNELTLEVAEELRAAGPWGQGFPTPVFDGVFEVKQRRWVGERHLKMRLCPPDSNRLIEAIAFYAQDCDWSGGVDQIRLAYRLEVNEYQGRREVQLVAEYIEPSGSSF